jgi:hypothetical protein
LVIAEEVPNGTRGKLKLYLKPANASAKQGKNHHKRAKTAARQALPAKP